MKTERPFTFQAALGLTAMLGLAAGLLTGRWSSAHRETQTAGGSLLSARQAVPGEPAGAVSRAHTEQEREHWLAAARKAAEGNGLGFEAELDAPGLLLSVENLTAGDFPLLAFSLEQFPDTPGRKRLEEWLLKAWSLKNPLEALAWAEKCRTDLRPGALEAWARRDPAAALEAVKDDPSLKIKNGVMDSDTSVFRTVFATWAGRDRRAALQALADFGAAKRGHEAILARNGFMEGALPDAVKFPEQWAADRDALAGEILQLPEARERRNILGSLAEVYQEQITGSADHRTLLDAGRKEVGEWLGKLPLNEELHAALLRQLAQRDGTDREEAPEAYAWLWKEVPDSQRAETLDYIVRHWAEEAPWSARDPDACGRWLNSLGPLGPEYAAALKSFAEVAAVRDPVAGLAWAGQIADPIPKKEAMKSVTELIRKQWPDRADALLAK
ncbi:MAG: hypothetical protein V4726_22785 [Verrucomicrobiota bacterium]